MMRKRRRKRDGNRVRGAYVAKCWFYFAQQHQTNTLGGLLTWKIRCDLLE